jgi:hypothetical protein
MDQEEEARQQVTKSGENCLASTPIIFYFIRLPPLLYFDSRDLVVPEVKCSTDFAVTCRYIYVTILPVYVLNTGRNSPTDLYFTSQLIRDAIAEGGITLTDMTKCYFTVKASWPGFWFNVERSLRVVRP